MSKDGRLTNDLVSQIKVTMESHKHQVGLDCNKDMDMVVKVAMECQKHQEGLDCNKDMDMVVKVAMEQWRANSTW